MLDNIPLGDIFGPNIAKLSEGKGTKLTSMYHLCQSNFDLNAQTYTYVLTLFQNL